MAINHYLVNINQYYVVFLFYEEIKSNIDAFVSIFDRTHSIRYYYDVYYVKEFRNLLLLVLAGSGSNVSA